MVKTSYKLAVTLAIVPVLWPILFLAYNTLVSGYVGQGPGHIGKAFQVFLALAFLSYAITVFAVLSVFFVLRSRGISSLRTLPLWTVLTIGLLMFAYALLRPSDVPDMLIVVTVALVTFNATIFCMVLRWKTMDVVA